LVSVLEGAPGEHIDEALLVAAINLNTSNWNDG